MRRFRVPALLGMVLSAGAADLHPSAFRPVLCWWSDATQPIATEINLTAVKEDRNQFEADKVWEREGWTGVDVDAGFLKYRVVSDQADVVEYLVADSGGGATMVHRIVAKRGKRTLMVDGKAREFAILTINEISLVEK